MNRRVTLKDIAAATGVHPSTVSRALDPAGRATLTEALVTRVREAAARMGYRRNQIASSLRTHRTMTVGVVLPDVANPLFPPILRGIESVLEPLGYTSIIVNTDNLPEREERLLSVLRERGVDGLIHAAVQRNDPAVTRQIDGSTPLITLNRRIERSSIPCVVNDEAGGVRMMLEHLAEFGHTRIATISGPLSLSTGHMRDRAMRESAREMGLDQPPEWRVAASGFSEAEGRLCCAALLARGLPFTALLCANDRLALGAIAALRDAGLRCPEDVSVTGFNDMPFLDLMAPRLTTIRIAQYDAGVLAAEMLARMMRGADSLSVPIETVLPVRLVTRDSVAPPARRVIEVRRKS